MSEHQKEVIDRLQKINRSLSSRGSLRSRMFSALEKLVVPIFLGALAFIVSHASNQIAADQNDVSRERLKLEKQRIEETIDVKYIEIFFDMLATGEPSVCRQALNVLRNLNTGKAIVFSEIVVAQQPCGETVGDEAKQLTAELSDKFQKASFRQRTVRILNDIDTLSDDGARALAANPPVVGDEMIDAGLKARDPANKKPWLTDPGVAKQALKFMLSLTSSDDLIKWERATKATAVVAARGTYTTLEELDKSVSLEEVEKLKEERLEAGAITSEIRDERYKWVLATEWNAIVKQ